MITAEDYLSLRPDAVTRPVAWRWELARHLEDQRRGDEPVHHPDPDVVAAADVMHALDAPDERRRVAAYAKIPTHQADAFVFHQRTQTARDTAPPPAAFPGAKDDDYPVCGPLSADALARAQVEAMVLARKSPEYIARHVGLSPAAVAQYERWWFDVRDRLTKTGWVAANVIGSLYQGSPATLIPALIRAYGYYTRSTRVIQTTVGMFDPAAARQAAGNPAGFFASDAASAGALKAAVAVRMMPLTRRTYPRVLELHHQAAEVAVKAGQLAGRGGSADAEQYREAVNNLLGRADVKYNKPPVELAPKTPRLVDVQDDAG